MIKLVVGAALGAAIGGWIGYASKCSGGGCPLMGNPAGGAMFGAVIGILMASSIAGRTSTSAVHSEHVIEVAGVEAFDALLKAHPVALVDFYADWCGPCRKLKPAIHELADTYEGRAAVLAVNVDRNRELAERHGVSGIPDVRVFKDGQEKKRFVGLGPKTQYSSAIDSLLAGE